MKDHQVAALLAVGLLFIGHFGHVEGYCMEQAAKDALTLLKLTTPPEDGLA